VIVRRDRRVAEALGGDGVLDGFRHRGLGGPPDELWEVDADLCHDGTLSDVASVAIAIPELL
jgi:hypothetical protein